MPRNDTNFGIRTLESQICKWSLGSGVPGILAAASHANARIGPLEGDSASARAVSWVANRAPRERLARAYIG